MHLRAGERAIHCAHGAAPLIPVRCNDLLDGESIIATTIYPFEERRWPVD
jgi:hypothetical protein